jgi:hypothetical protein
MGTGTMTPIGGGTVGTGLGIAPPLPYTWLSLPRYAQILGINPVHFQGAVGQTVWSLKNNRCEDIWPRHSWQNADQVSREDLAYAIKQAEDEMSSFLGYPMAPTWVTNENHQYTQFHRPDMYASGGLNSRGQRKSVKTKFAKVIQAGRRTVDLIGNASVSGGSLAFTDEDGDGFFERATVTYPTTETSACEINAYFTGMGGVKEWEIRPAKSKTITGGNVILVYESWLFIDPDLQAAHPDEDDFGAIDITTTSNFVSSVDIYREYTDNTVASAQFFWEPETLSGISTCSSCGGSGCVSCTFTTQNGCLLVRDVEGGWVVPAPGSYDATSAQWTSSAYSVGRDPDQVKLWYYAGDMDDSFLSGTSCDPLSEFFARAIAWLATARIERPFCQCGNVTSLVDSWREELSAQGEVSHLIDFNLLSSPFGTRRGELMAYRALSMLNKRKISSGVI